jgi:FkbM family methyltransferase
MTADANRVTGLRRALAAVKRRLAYARRYRSYGDWLTSYYDALVRARPGWPWPGGGRLAAIGLRALAAPSYLRLGSTDWFVAEEVFLRDVYAVVRGAAPADTRTIVDLGANVGLTLALWHSWWPQARMVAVEPDDDNLRVLARNVSPFVAQVQTVRACAVGAAREVQLDRHAGQAAYRLVAGGQAAGDSLPGRTVADILQTHAIDELDLLKCDIEGAEREVFSACAAWIGRVRCMVVEVHDDLTIPELAGMLARAGGRFDLVDAGDPTIAVFRRRA